MALGTSIGDIVSGATEEEEARRQAESLRGLGLSPEFFGGDYEQESSVGDFTPTLFDDPSEAQYQTVAEDPRVRGMQTDALQQLINTTSGAADARMAVDSGMALDEANQLARGREGAIRMDAERKGQGGAGMDMVMRGQAAQMGANRARAGTQQAALDAALQKLAANEGMISGAGAVRGQDFQRNAMNSDIINRFNQFNTNARNQARQANVNMQNQAGMRNLETRQGTSNRNTGTRNRSIDRRDNIAGEKHKAMMDRWGLENDIQEKRASGNARMAGGIAGAGMDMVQAGMAGATGGSSGGGGRSWSGSSGAKKVVVNDKDDLEY